VSSFRTTIRTTPMRLAHLGTSTVGGAALAEIPISRSAQARLWGGRCGLLQWDAGLVRGSVVGQ
jgi:hypothetical protein